MPGLGRDTDSTEPALVDLLRRYGKHGQYCTSVKIFITISDIEDDEGEHRRREHCFRQ